jgi:hypothetical protein
VLAEFVRADAPDEVVATAHWDGPSEGVRIDPVSESSLAESLRRIFRPTPVVVDEPSLRPPGASGPVILEPGDLRWFIEAARIRAQREGLEVRLAEDDWSRMGWDPAGSYVLFTEAVGLAD